MSERLNLLCDMLDNQRRLTKWYLKRIPDELYTERVAVNGRTLNSPLWTVSHLIWTDYGIGMIPLGFEGAPPEWVQQTGFGSTGELPEGFPDSDAVRKALDDTHETKLAFIRELEESKLDEPYAYENLGFRNNYYALLHLARHEGVHCGQVSAFCKFHGIKTV